MSSGLLPVTTTAAASIAGIAGNNLAGPVFGGFVYPRRIANELPADGDQISLPFAQNALSNLRCVYAANRHHRYIDILFDYLRQVSIGPHRRLLQW